MKSILIIGGMGPQASLTLHQMIVDRAVKDGARHGEEFPSITHLSLPIPEFIESKDSIHAAVALIQERLYCLWRGRVYSCGYCLQHGSSNGSHTS